MRQRLLAGPRRPYREPLSDSQRAAGAEHRLDRADAADYAGDDVDDALLEPLGRPYVGDDHLRFLEPYGLQLDAAACDD